VAHGRIDAAGRFVVFQNLIGPPAKTHGLKPTDAFALILERCGYCAEWSEENGRIGLRFRQCDGELAPVRFDMPIRFGFETDKDFVMQAVFENGLRGWLALPSDVHAIIHSIAEQDLRQPSRLWRWLGTTAVPR